MSLLSVNLLLSPYRENPILSRERGGEGREWRRRQNEVGKYTVSRFFSSSYFFLQSEMRHYTEDSSVLVSENVLEIFLQGLYDMNILCMELES